MLKKMDLEDLKEINGGQIFFARTGNETGYFVPWAAENDVNFYNRAWDAKVRAEDLGLSSELIECGSVWTAISAAKIQAIHSNAVNRVNAFVG